MEEAIGSGRVLVPARVLIEAYSVMTRLPSAQRVAARDALALLEGVRPHVEVVQLADSELWDVLGALSREGLGGGLTYDAEILWSAARAGATRLLTLNPRDFERLPSHPCEIVTPPGR